MGSVMLVRKFSDWPVAIPWYPNHSSWKDNTAIARSSKCNIWPQRRKGLLYFRATSCDALYSTDIRRLWWVLLAYFRATSCNVLHSTYIRPSLWWVLALWIRQRQARQTNKQCLLVRLVNKQTKATKSVGSVCLLSFLKRTHDPWQEHTMWV